MKLNAMLQEGEENYCLNEHGGFDMFIVSKNWRCPICDELLTIKAEINNYEHSINRVTPVELEIGEIITLDNNYIREILDIREDPKGFRVALKEYRVIYIDPSSIVTRVIGRWNR